MRKHAAYAELFLTVRPPTEVPTDAATAIALEQAATAIASHGAAPFHERLYGPLAAREATLASRAEAFTRAGLDPTSPCLYVDGKPGETTTFSGLRIWAIVPKSGSGCEISTIELSDGIAARSLRSPGQRLVILTGIHGREEGAPATMETTAQAVRMWKRAGNALDELGLGLRHVVYTWIHVARILHWYGEFNRVRTAYLTGRGIDGRLPEAPFPASTGIRGTSRGEACIMNLLAAQDRDGPTHPFQPIHQTGRQRTPFAYGSSFSRGMALSRRGAEKIFVSGTASIDAEGNSVHIARPEYQVLETLLGVASVLEGAGGTLADIVSATVFYKDPDALSAFKRVTNLLGVADFPYLPVRADVCRPELLVEIEAEAVFGPRPERER